MDVQSCTRGHQLCSAKDARSFIIIMSFGVSPPLTNTSALRLVKRVEIVMSDLFKDTEEDCSGKTNAKPTQPPAQLISQRLPDLLPYEFL